MNRNRIVACSALGLLLAVTGCNVPDGAGNGDEDVVVADDQGGLAEHEQGEGVAAPADQPGVKLIAVAPGIQREMRPGSTEPTAEITTRTGSYVAIWVHADGSSSVFEGIPVGAASALKEVQADSPKELFLALAPAGMTPPAGLRNGRAFSVLEAEARERIAALPPEGRLLVDDDAEEESAASQQHVMAGASCDSGDANYFYDDFRPGVYDDSEAVLEYTPANQQYREARRRMDYQFFRQVTSNQWSLTQSPGGMQAAYFRISALLCAGSGRISLYRCASSQGTADNGCGEAGSTIASGFPAQYTINTGVAATYKDWAGGDISRAYLDQMNSASDRAILTFMGSNSSYGAINSCYN